MFYRRSRGKRSDAVSWNPTQATTILGADLDPEEGTQVVTCALTLVSGSPPPAARASPGRFTPPGLPSLWAVSILRP